MRPPRQGRLPFPDAARFARRQRRPPRIRESPTIQESTFRCRTRVRGGPREARSALLSSRQRQSGCDPISWDLRFAPRHERLVELTGRPFRDAVRITTGRGAPRLPTPIGRPGASLAGKLDDDAPACAEPALAGGGAQRRGSTLHRDVESRQLLEAQDVIDVRMMHAVPAPTPCGRVAVLVTYAAVPLAHRAGENVIAALDQLSCRSKIPPRTRGIAKQHGDHLIGWGVDARRSGANPRAATTLVSHHVTRRTCQLVPGEIL